MQLLIFKNSLQELASECFDCEMCSLKTMNELKPHGCPTAQLGLVNSCCRTDGWAAANGKESPQVIQMSSVSPQCGCTNICRSMRFKKKKKTTFPKHPSIHFLLPFPAAEDSCLQARGGAHPGQLQSHNSLVLLHDESFKCIWICIQTFIC